MKTTLQTLIFESGMNQKRFAEKVGVKLKTLQAQVRRKNTLELTYKYATILGVKSIKGYESGIYVELIIG